MAEKENQSSSGWDGFEIIILTIIIISILLNISAFVGPYLEEGRLWGLFLDLPIVGSSFEALSLVLPFFYIGSIILSAIFIMVLIYITQRTSDIIEDMRKNIYSDKTIPYIPNYASYVMPGNNEVEEAARDKGEEDHEVTDLSDNRRWNKVQNLLRSEDQEKWRLAIIEADIMLGELLDTIGYRAPSIGEKLKQIKPGGMTNTEEAWVAHKFRNRIAHEGSNMLVSEREAKRIIGLYKKVFREFNYI